MWVKFRYKFAYGYNDWQYIEIPDDWQSYGYAQADYDEEKKHSDRYIREGYSYTEALGDYLSNEERLHEQYNYSDKYRGFDYEPLEGLPPNKELLKRLNRARSNAEHWANEVKRFQEMVDATGEITKSDFSV